MRVSFSATRALLVLGAIGLLLFAVSCGGDDDNGATVTATSPPATTAAPEGPGLITLRSTAITGQSGKILLVFATPESGGERLARACIQINSDSFEVPAVAMTDVPAGNDPCASGTSETSLGEGTYQVTAGVYVGGQQTAEAETSITIDVAGDTTVQLDGSELSE